MRGLLAWGDMGLDDDAEIGLWLDVQEGRFDQAYARLTRAMIVVTDPARRSRLEAAFGVILQRAGLTAYAMDRFARALDIAEGSAEEHSFVLALSSMSCAVSGDLDRACEQAEEALRLGERVGAAFAIGQANTTLTLVHLGDGRPQEALARAEAAVRQSGGGTGQDEYRALAYVLQGMAYVELDRLVDAQASIAHGVALASEEQHDSGQLSVLLASKALLDFIQGDWDSAVTSAGRALDVAQRTGLLVSRGLAWGIAACVEGYRGNTSVGQHLVELAVANRQSPFGGLGEEWVSLASATLAPDADRQYDALCDAWFRMAGVPYQLAWKLCAHPLVEAAVERGDLGVAEAVTRTAEVGAERAGGVDSARAAALCCRGALARTLGPLESGIALLRGAGRPLQLGVSCRSAARLATEAGEHELSLRLMREAAEAFQGLGATGMSALTAFEIVRASTRPTSALQPPEEWATLTGAERRVARLAATGLTNRQIAAELGVSPRTVQTQLAGACAKFGVTSRVQLAAAIAGIDIG